MGLNKVRKYKLKCIIAVGISVPTKEYKNIIMDFNKIKNGSSFFYIQGGIDYNKLKGMKKIGLKIVASSIIKENKKENESIIDVLKNGGSLEKEESLDDIINYISEN